MKKISNMNKTQLMAELNERNVEFEETQTVPELQELLTAERPEENKLSMNASEIQKKAADEKRVVKRTDRVRLIVLKATRFYKKGDKIRPHRVYAEDLLEKKIAREWTKAELKAEEDEKKEAKKAREKTSSK